MSNARPHARLRQQEQMARISRDAYATHEIREESDGRWLLQRRHEDGGWRSEYWTEIIALHHGGLLVDGDVDPVIFRYGPQNPEARVRWMGSRSAAHDPYFRSKARIGTGLPGVDMRWDVDAARDDLRELAAELRAEAAESRSAWDYGNAARRTCAVDDALEDVEDEHAVRQILYDGDVDPEATEHLGMVTASRLYYAHAALARLCVLLDAARGDAPAEDGA